MWSHTFALSEHRNWVVIALPGSLDKLDLKSTELGLVSLKIRWFPVKRTPVKLESSHTPDFPTANWFEKSTSGSAKVSNAPIFFDVTEVCKGYNSHRFLLSLEGVMFVFTKCADKTFSTSTEFLPYLRAKPIETTNLFSNLFSNFSFAKMFVDMYPQSCPVRQHQSKLFSWYQSKVLCRSIDFDLPEFMTKTTQEMFLLLIKQASQVFSVDAVFLNLKRSSRSQTQQMVSEILWLKTNFVLPNSALKGV